jgi:uncharacterized damage-inducible protein DinB
MVAAFQVEKPIFGELENDKLPAAVLPLVGVLRQLMQLLEALTDAQFVQKPVGVVPSSVGGHVRHNLDHIEALLNGLDNGTVDYDARQRDTEVERSRRSAVDALRWLEFRFLATEWPQPDQPLALSVLLAPDIPPVEVETTLGRELAFVLSHTIHHNALIGVMAKLFGIPLPENFGYAPSTIAHQQRKLCAH